MAKESVNLFLQAAIDELNKIHPATVMGTVEASNREAIKRLIEAMSLLDSMYEGHRQAGH